MKTRNIFAAKLPVRFLVALSLVSLMPVQAAAWGRDGHRIVARIAARHLTAKTIASALKLLDSDPIDSGNCLKHQSLEERMVCMSTWADEIKRDSRFRDTANKHFIDIPIYVPESERHFIYERDCLKGDCLSDAIEEYKTTLAKSDSAPERALALKFLIHLVGDVHQPLHVATDLDRDSDSSVNRGEKSDLGGNLKLIKWLGIDSNQFGCLNLHGLWDEDIINRREDENTPATDDYSRNKLYAYSLDKQLAARDIFSFQQGKTIDWVNESYKLAVEYAYGALPPPVIETFCEGGTTRRCGACIPKETERVRVHRKRYHLDESYYDKTRPIVEQQLSRAGIRLAKLLDDIFSPASAQPRRSTRKVSQRRNGQSRVQASGQ